MKRGLFVFVAVLLLVVGFQSPVRAHEGDPQRVMDHGPIRCTATMNSPTFVNETSQMKFSMKTVCRLETYPYYQHSVDRISLSMTVWENQINTDPEIHFKCSKNRYDDSAATLTCYGDYIATLTYYDAHGTSCTEYGGTLKCVSVSNDLTW